MNTVVNWADGLTAVVTLCAFVLAFASFALAAATWRVQSEPEVVVYATPDLGRPSVVNLVIENMGQGVARNVQFVTSQRMPHLAFGFENAEVAAPMTDGPIIHGIAFLHPGERRVITWGQYHGLKKSLAGPVTITATCSYKPFYRWRDGERAHASVIDIESFKLSEVADRNWDKRAALALEKIEHHLARLLRSNGDETKLAEHDDD